MYSQRVTECTLHWTRAQQARGVEAEMILPGHCFIIKSPCVYGPLRGSWSSPWSTAAAVTDRYATALYFFDVGATASDQLSLLFIEAQQDQSPGGFFSLVLWWTVLDRQQQSALARLYLREKREHGL